MNSAQRRILRRAWTLSVAAIFLLSLSKAYAARVTGLKEVPFTDTGKLFPVVQVLPNYYFSPDCNEDYCAVLFTGGKSRSLCSQGLQRRSWKA